jgi:DNA-binding response OmpR family regulator
MTISTQHYANEAQDTRTTKTIILVEDDATHAEMLQFVLHSETPYRVLSFESSTELLHHLDEIKSIHPVLFMLDYKLTHSMSGLELYDHLHTITEFVDTPALLLTANLSSDVEDAVALRDISLLYKPFEIDDLLSIVQGIMKS